MIRSFSVKKQISPLFPQAIVYNNTPVPIYIIIDCTWNDHHSTAHSIVELAANSNTKECGIHDPEAIICAEHLRVDDQGNIWAPRFTPLIKTPAGSKVHVHDASTALVAYTDQASGTLGHLARIVRIRPSIKDTNRFSNGQFVSPIVESPLFKAYTILAQTLKEETP